MGLIALEGMHFYAYHGFYEEEQKIGNEYMVDVYVKANFEEAAESDSIAETLNYERIQEATKAEMSVKHKLLETIGSNIAHRLFDHYEIIEHIKVRVSKLRPQMGSPIARAMIEFELLRES